MAHDAPTVAQAETDEDIRTIRELLTEYESAIGIDLCFQGFADELANLPQHAPWLGGSLLLARCKRDVAGCVALLTYR